MTWWEQCRGGPILNGAEVGGQRGLQLLEAGGGANRGQVVCIGHCERGQSARKKLKRQGEMKETRGTPEWTRESGDAAPW